MAGQWRGASDFHQNLVKIWLETGHHRFEW